MKERSVPAGCAPTFVVSKIFAINLKMYFWHTDNISLRKNTKLACLGFVKHTHKNCVLWASFGPDLGGSFKNQCQKRSEDFPGQKNCYFLMNLRFDNISFYVSWNNNLKYIFSKYYVNLEVASAWFSWKTKKW